MGLTRLKSGFLQGCVLLLETRGEKSVPLPLLASGGHLYPPVHGPSLHLQSQRCNIFSLSLSLTLLLPLPLIRTLTITLGSLG